MLRFAQYEFKTFEQKLTLFIWTHLLLKLILSIPLNIYMNYSKLRFQKLGNFANYKTQLSVELR